MGDGLKLLYQHYYATWNSDSAGDQPNKTGAFHKRVAFPDVSMKHDEIRVNSPVSKVDYTRGNLY